MLRTLFLLLLFQTVTADETTRLLSSLLRRVGTLERNVEILGEQLDELRAEMHPGTHHHGHSRTPSTAAQRKENTDDEWPLNTVQSAEMTSTVTNNEGGVDFKITNISARFSSFDGDTTFVIRYQAQGDQPLIMVAPDYKNPPSRVDHAMGTVHIIVPQKETSPVVYVYTSSGLFYTLILINQLGPPLASNFSNVAVSTFPEPPITFGPNEEPELTFTSTVTGSRKVASQRLTYVVYPLLDYSDVVAEKFLVASSSSQEEDEEREQSGKQRLREIERTEGRNGTLYRFKLDTSFEDRGVLFLEQSVVWDCTDGCFLYKTVVNMPVLYFRDGLYEMSGARGSAIVPNLRGQPRQAGNYVNFISYDPKSPDHEKTCLEGEDCVLICEAFGDYPRVGFRTNVDIGSMPGVRSWSMTFGYLGLGFVHFESVSKEAEGQYQCHASLGTGSKVRNIGLRVTDKVTDDKRRVTDDKTMMAYE